MFSRALYLIVGVLLYLSSTPVGMAKETISKEARADFFAYFVSAENENDFIGEQETISQNNNLPNSLSDNSVLPIGDALIPMGQPGSPAGDSETENESKQKKNKKNRSNRLNGKKVKTRLSLTRASKGIARNPLTQDAQQERTAAIRFLHLAAAID